MRPITRLFALVGAACLGGACMQYDFRVVIPESTKEVKKTVAAAHPTPVDILFVVDNSGSMAEEQANLARNFDQFINELTKSKGNDYRLAIVTTDAGGGQGARNINGPERSGQVVSTFRTTAPFSLITNGTDACHDISDIKHGCFRGDDASKRVITSDMSADDQINTFKANVLVGTCGNGYEEGLEGMKLGLSRSGGDCPGQPEFLRDDANLVVVIVSDENDSTDPAPPVQSYVDWLIQLKKGSGSNDDGRRKLRTAVIVASQDGGATNCNTMHTACGGNCNNRPPAGSHNACAAGMNTCGAGEYCETQAHQCENQDLQFWQYCYWCSFYNTPDCCSALSGGRYVDFAKAIEAEVHSADASIDVVGCRGDSTKHVACLIDSICQDEFADTLKRIARDLIITNQYSLSPVAKYPPGVVVEVNGKPLKNCNAVGATMDCDFKVAADGGSLTITRNAPGENDTVDIYFVVAE
ncbi:MAG: vWA domain-containing protein [Myxococcota bacterium]